MIPILFALALAQVEDIPRPPAAQSQAVIEAFGTFTLSTGLGEDTVSPAAGIRLGHQKLYLTAFYERSRKVESGKGFIAGVDLEHRRGGWLTGVSAHMRDGGRWRKYPVMLSMGYTRGGFSVYATQETLTFGDDGPGSEQTRSLTVRTRYKAYEQKAAIYWAKTHNSEGVGAILQITLRVGRRSR